jgi:hypothetical protein
MDLKKILPYAFFSIVLSAWFFSLLMVYIPTTSWVTPTFPLTIDANMKTLFLALTVLSALTSMLMGLKVMGKLTQISKKLRL